MRQTRRHGEFSREPKASACPAHRREQGIGNGEREGRGDSGTRGRGHPQVRLYGSRPFHPMEFPLSISTDIARDLAALGVRRGDVLLVHSSLKSLGRPDCAPADVIEALRAALGDGGTLLLPALSYATVSRERPLFDVLRTPACVGAIPEFFRTMGGVLRSVHPTHSVCGLGLRAAELLADQERDATPCGEHSAFRRLPEAGGKVLMLGCGLRPNTSMHAVEELVEPPPFLGDPVAYAVTLAGGGRIVMSVRRHSFVNQSLRQRYDRLGPLLDRDGLRTGKVLSADAHLIDARAMWRAALAAMRENPFFFTERVG
jgi:aminoglycoside 3-N-acetyltransferase